MLNLLLFYSTYASGFLASLLVSPVFAFVLYQAVYFYNPQQRWWGYMVPDLSYSFYVVVLMLVLMVFNWSDTKKNLLLKIPQFKWMYFGLFLYGAAYFYAIFQDLHLQYFKYFLNTVVIVSIAYKLCDTDAKLNKILYGYIFGAWYIGFVAFQTGRNSGGGRVEGIGTVDSPDANGIAAAIAPSLVFCLYYFWINKRWLNRFLIVIAGAFIANGLVLINSRGAFLAVILGAGYFMLHMYFSSFQRRYQKSIAVIITLFGLAGTAVIVDQSTIERFASIAKTTVTTEKESGGTRVLFWLSAFEMSKDHPFGSGYRGFNFYAPLYIPKEVDTGRSRHRAVHSSWFEALTESGYLGLLALCAMIFTAFRSLRSCRIELKNRQEIDQYFKIIAIEGALLAFVVAMTFLNRMRAEILYWCILYSACAYNIYVLKMKQTNPVIKS
jgi:hypothetical protein